MLVRYVRLCLLLGLASLIAISFFFRGHQEPSSQRPSILQTNPSSRAIVAFWAKWASVFDEARPMVQPVIVNVTADYDDPKILPKERQPTLQTLELSHEDIWSLRHSHAQLVGHEDFGGINADAGRLYKGRGIVTVAGGEYFPPALLSIRMLRKTNCTLPVHVFLPSPAEYEPIICEELLPALGADCFVIEDYLKQDARFKILHFQLKALAILFSSFEEVVYIDADCLALHDPAVLLEQEPYKSTGFVNWPDFWMATEDPAFYIIAGLPGLPKGLPPRSTESGQLLFDKRRHLDTLVLAAYYNVFGPHYFYQILSQNAHGEGDKETFLAAATVLKRPYYRVQGKPGSVGYKDDMGEYRGRGMVQYDPTEDHRLASDNGSERSDNATVQPRPFFLHANLAKLNVGRLVDGKDLYLPGFGERHRLWGSADGLVEEFGYDVEKVVWWEMVDLACQLAHTLKDFKKHGRICKKARTHYKAIFDHDILFP